MIKSPSFSLVFDGRCEEAFKFYEQHLGGRISFMLPWADSPMAKDAPPEWGRKLLHATLTIGETVFAGGDLLPGSYESPRGFSVMLGMRGESDAERVFAVLAQSGTITVPLQETFWASRFGAVIDQFGIPWSINCEKS